MNFSVFDSRLAGSLKPSNMLLPLCAATLHQSGLIWRASPHSPPSSTLLQHPFIKKQYKDKSHAQPGHAAGLHCADEQGEKERKKEKRPLSMPQIKRLIKKTFIFPPKCDIKLQQDSCRLETRERSAFVFTDEGSMQQENKKTWRIEKSPTPESLRLQLETHLHKC